MKTRTAAGFTLLEVVVALLLFSVLTTGILVMSEAMRTHQTASRAANDQNAYATFQSEVALQGINPSLVGNPLAGAINQAGTSTATAVSLGSNTSLQVVRQDQAAFEVGGTTLPTGAQRVLAGSAQVDGLNYAVASAGSQGTRGAGIGFGVQLTGPAVTPLAPPSFNVQGDLTAAPFPLNDILTLPGTNPSGTFYTYTTDGSTPLPTSPVWNNNPGWTPATFPAQVTVAAFSNNPAYSPSVPVSATYTMQAQLTYGRADGRTTNLYGFTLSDLQDPDDTGIVLGTNVSSVPGVSVYYTLDGTTPGSGSPDYSDAFVPAQAQFSPGVTLQAVAISTDPRIQSSAISTYDLTTIAVPLQPPTFDTGNSAPLSPGTPVVISLNGSGGAPRTAVNDGAPTNNSSSATSFPLN